MGCFNRKGHVTDSVTGVWAHPCAYRRIGYFPEHKLIEDEKMDPDVDENGQILSLCFCATMQ
eukprot:4396606-Pleurochrysis_carterae.AAC.1